MKLQSFRSPWIYSATVFAILIGHFIVDTYSSMVAPLIGVIETEFSMDPKWSAILLGIGSMISGLSQPVFAWISDRTGSRAFGAIGIVLGALGIGLIGFSSSVSMVFAMFAVGMVGIGMFHPIASARIGAIAGNQRGFALSLFFVFGMGGFFTGSLVGPNLVTQTGTLESLWQLIIPGLVIAVFFQATINRKTETGKSKAKKANHSLADYNWLSIYMLYFSAVFRFFVNMALVYLIVRWVEHYVGIWNPEFDEKQVATTASPIAGVAAAVMFVGQGVGGLLAGTVIPHGRERIPLIVTPIIFAPFIMLLATCPPGVLGYSYCFAAGIGFAAMTPITISVGQQLMPSHTRLASGITLGGAWVFAGLGPSFSEWLLNSTNLATAFVVTGALLTLAGFCAIGVRAVAGSKDISHR